MHLMAWSIFSYPEIAAFCDGNRPAWLDVCAAIIAERTIYPCRSEWIVDDH